MRTHSRKAPGLLIIIAMLLSLTALDSHLFAQRRRASRAHPYASTAAIRAPHLFAEGIVNTAGDEYGPTFTPDGRTLYFAKRSADRKMEHIYFSRYAEGKWSEPQLAPFSGKYFDKEPFITSDGTRLFFSSKRPVDGAKPERNDFNLWMVERTRKGAGTWSEAKPLGAAVNSDTYDNYPSVAANGTVYFSSTRAGGKGSNDLYRARFVNGQYAPAENLASLNTPESDADPYIAPDESYMIISSTRNGTYGEGDLYISFNLKGAWTTPRNLGVGVNSETYEYTPLVSPDGKYLFFSRGWGEIYQLDLSALPFKREAGDRVATTVAATKDVTKDTIAARNDPAKSETKDATKSVARRQVAVTFDDLPFTADKGATDVDALRGFTMKLLATLTTHKIPAVGFVNEKKLEREGRTEEARIALLKMWTDAELELGNHTYSHADFYRTPLADFQQEVVKGEPVTRSLLAARGMKLRYFRHPYLRTGRDLKTREAFEKFLTERGYAVAPVTIDNSEWIFAQAYDDAMRRGDQETMRRVAAEYVPYMEQMFDFYERWSVDLFGHEIQQVLLVHANALNAHHFGDIALMIKRRGYSFITLEDALRDKAYQHPDTYAGPWGISWLQRWAMTRGQKFTKEPTLSPYMQQFAPAGSGS